MDERNSGFWSGVGVWFVLEALLWAVLVLAGALINAADLAWGWNVAIGVVLVVAIVLGLRRRYGGRQRRL